MNQRNFFIYWNELSFPENVVADELKNNPAWKTRALQAFEGISQLLRMRSDCRISLSKGIFHRTIGDRSLSSWLEFWLGKDAYRRLKGRLVQPLGSVEEVHQLDCELECLGRSGEGITRAHIAESWVWSLGGNEAGSDKELIIAHKTTVESKGQVVVNVFNISESAHALFWEQELSAWGESISSNNIVSSLNGYHVIMYPLDHGYPHVHVQSISGPWVEAKYRIDVFEPLTDKQPKSMDEMMKDWILLNRETLKVSWARCLKGCFPLKI